MCNPRRLAWLLPASAFLIVCLLPHAGAQTCLSYEFVRIAKTGDLGLAAIDPDVSLNDQGDVAFIGRFPESGTNIVIPNIFVGTGQPNSLHSISPSVTSGFQADLGEGLRITNQDKIIIRRKLSIPSPFGPETETYLESWNANAINGNTTLVFAQPLGTEFDGIYGYPSMNNLGGFVFAALDAGNNYLATSTPAGGFKVQLVSELLHPVMTDDSQFIGRLGSDQVVKFPPAFFPYVVIAGPSAGGFTSVGREPGATDDGSIVAFIGDRGQGKGVFVNVPNGAGKATLHVAGEGQDNFSDFDGEQRVGVVKGAAADPAVVTLVFVGTHFGLRGVYSIDGKPTLNSQTGQLNFADAAVTQILRIGDSIDGQQVSSVDLYDPINASGQVAIRVGFANGAQSIERAQRVPAPVVTLRVSAKRILSHWTNQSVPTWGNPHAPSGPDWAPVCTAIKDASSILEREIGVKLDLVETVDVVDPLYPVSWFLVNTQELDLYEAYAEAQPCTLAWRTNAMNIYLVSEAVGDSGGAAALPFFPNQSKNDIVFVGADVEDVARAIAHEVGHHVGLLHTHEGGLYGVENAGICLAEGSNCGIAGDLVCDTPFDPQIEALLDAGYGSGSCFGAGSPPFNALRYNVMSYYFGINKDNAVLTAGQGCRAMQMIELFRQDEVVTAPNTPLVPYCPWLYLGHGLAGSAGIPTLVGAGPLTAASPATLMLFNAKPASLALLFVSLASTPSPFKGGTLVTVPVALTLSLGTDASGALTLPFVWPAAVPSATPLYFQFAVQDPAAIKGAALSNALKAVTP